ncbi:hypothetical protein [Rhizorhabdus phycosphaerae]|uniref:hypothetical protein n=1 Tax=Rhizorhabdus phycosphaerae TaxID=2711156 RepID=UPI0013EB6917|nr:hypothetical protein [Rhizorhabdus phycosphaerae]
MTAHRASLRHAFALAALLLASAAAQAEETVIALSPAEKEKLLDAAAQKPRPVGELPVNGVIGKVHGQVGMFVGTGGARGVFGTAVAPVGETGQIAVSFENSRFRY